MSYQTWAEKFYPVAAELVPEEQALAHSLQKWKGLTEENLDAHGLSLSPGKKPESTT